MSSHSCSPPAMLDLKKLLFIFFSQRPKTFGHWEKKGVRAPFFHEMRKNRVISYLRGTEASRSDHGCSPR